MYENYASNINTLTTKYEFLHWHWSCNKFRDVSSTSVSKLDESMWIELAGILHQVTHVIVFIHIILKVNKRELNRNVNNKFVIFSYTMQKYLFGALLYFLKYKMQKSAHKAFL